MARDALVAAGRLAAASLLLAARGAGRGAAGLSDPADPADHSVPARRQQRHRRPRDRDATERAARQADRRRQPQPAPAAWSAPSSPSKAPKDGYTLLVISLAHAVNPWLYKLPYDPIKAFTPIASWPPAPTCSSVHPSLPVKTVKELIALAKEKPGQCSYASAGVGSFQHLGAELFKLEARVNLLHVPFKGGGPALIDVLGGHTKVMFSSLVQAVPHIKSGKLRALGIGGKRARRRPCRSSDDRGSRRARLRGASTGGASWRRPARRRRSSPGCTRRWRRSQDSPEIQEQFAKEGAATRKMSSAEFGDFMEREMNKWERVVKEGGIKAE